MRLKWFYPVISVLIISVALLVFEINKLDRQYSQLIEKGVNQLSLVRQLTSNSNRRHILLFYIAHSKDTTVRAQWVNERNSLQEENDSIFTQLTKIDANFPERAEIIKRVSEARQIYLARTQDYISKIMSSPNPYIDSEADIKLDSFFLNYQKQINKLFSLETQNVSTLSDLFSSKVEKRSLWISLFSVSPFLILLVLLVALYFLLERVMPRSSEP